MSIFSRVVGAGMTGGSLLGGNAKAVLIPEAIGMPVQFSFNPESVTVSKKVKTEGQEGMIMNEFEDAVKAAGNLQIKLRKAHLTGVLTTQLAIKQLMDWVTPAPEVSIAGTVGALANQLGSAANSAMTGVRSAMSGGISGALGGLSTAVSTRSTTVSAASFAGVGVTYRLPVLLFMWGLGGPLGSPTKVTLETLTVKIERFDWTGIPVWATVDLDLVEYVNATPFTNPTSGGLPGRAKHVVTAGESVVRIANQSYGTPMAWRAVAEANRLDDPLRVKPGKVLHLPSPMELGEGVAS